MHYRAYLLSEQGGIVTFLDLDALDDADAEEQARHLRDGYDVEVWQHSRKVAVIKIPGGPNRP